MKATKMRLLWKRKYLLRSPYRPKMYCDCLKCNMVYWRSWWNDSASIYYGWVRQTLFTSPHQIKPSLKQLWIYFSGFRKKLNLCEWDKNTIKEKFSFAMRTRRIVLQNSDLSSLKFTTSWNLRHLEISKLCFLNIECLPTSWLWYVNKNKYFKRWRIIMYQYNNYVYDKKL